MTITVDSAPSTRQLKNPGSSLTYSFTYAGGAGAIYVSALCTSGANISSITWNGESLTRLNTHTSAASADLELWRLLNPSGSGAQNVVITLSASTTYILATTLSLLGSIGSGGATNVSAGADNTISVSNGSWVVLSAASDAVDVAASTNVTSANSANPLTGRYGPKSGSGSITLSVTGSGAFSIAAEVIDNNAGGGATPVPVFMNQYRQRSS